MVGKQEPPPNLRSLFYSEFFLDFTTKFLLPLDLILWYGYIYYILFNLIFLSSVFYMFRIYLFSNLLQTTLIQALNRVFLSQVLFFLLLFLVFLNYILNYYQSTLFFSSGNLNFSTVLLTSSIFHLDALSLNLVDVYVYPFIYIFLIVTMLSIIFCLSYNHDELINFMIFYQIIFLAGYLFFFTTSIIIFFFAYEMLLIPSFFILYKFAKTRRCVEAAYLMFF